MSAQLSGPALTLVFLEDAMVLTKRTFADWRAVQEHFPRYKASLEPDVPAHLVEYLSFDYPDMPEATGHDWSEVVAAFVASGAEEMPLARDGAWVCRC
ncbi:hypothetical protein [Paenirhodobacter hankyongi]|uniref:Uncharacterized protein n=1 Tax=Paenirhodobacter hankyongi TaxID=2294033 RepID=A0A421BU69_9RHOB|nr:hypothetical protein [Sinirhodobacter hankyongi]RLL71848.1 hypothetical protein DYS74_04340 [Sinirhodobacter hankyongi]